MQRSLTPAVVGGALKNKLSFVSSDSGDRTGTRGRKSENGVVDRSAATLPLTGRARGAGFSWVRPSPLGPGGRQWGDSWRPVAAHSAGSWGRMHPVRLAHLFLGAIRAPRSHRCAANRPMSPPSSWESRRACVLASPSWKPLSVGPTQPLSSLGRATKVRLNGTVVPPPRTVSRAPTRSARPLAPLPGLPYSGVTRGCLGSAESDDLLWMYSRIF